MKEIMQTYGAMIVAVVVGIALLSGFGEIGRASCRERV